MTHELKMFSWTLFVDRNLTIPLSSHKLVHLISKKRQCCMDGSSPSSVAELGVLNPVVEVQNRSGTHDEIGGVSNISLVSPPRTISPPLDSTTAAPLPSSAVPEQKTTSDDATTTATPLSRLGAWAKPIKILSPTTHLNLTLQTDGGEVAQIPFKEHWPPLSEQGFRPTRKDVTNMGSLKGIVPEDKYKAFFTLPYA
ncbi:hypothetical protein YC2023_087403 [Brassica napus]